MRINKLQTLNFCGLEGEHTFLLPNLAAFIGRNGIGKTTLLNAIRFALTGDEPDGDIINAHCQACTVSVWITDPIDGLELEFSRTKDRTKPSKCRIAGKATTKKEMDAKIEECIGIPLDKVRVTSSAGVLAAMKPQEFAAFILDYIPEKLKLGDIISKMPDSTLGMVNIMSANLPAEGIDLKTLDDFSDFCSYNRKVLKKQIESKKLALASKPQEAPIFTKEELEARVKVLNDIDNERKIYAVKKAAYDKALANAEKHKNMLEALKKDLTGEAAEKPNPAEIDAVNKRIVSINNSLVNQKTAIAGAKSALRQLEITLDALKKPICPVSPLIVCHTDKTVAKEEITESIKATREGIAAMETEVAKANEELAAAQKAVDAYRAKERAYEKKIAVIKQIKALEETIPEVPEKPEIEALDTAEEREMLARNLKYIEEYSAGIALKAQIESIETEFRDFDTLVKVMAEKGPVRTSVIKDYLGIFEEICNKRSAAARPGVTFEFRPEDGVKVYMNSKGSVLPYESLSNGEKAYMIFIIMDMLNSLTGTNILFLDELSVMDGEVFNALLDIIEAAEADYDHIVVAAVDYAEIVDAVTKHGIPMFNIEGCKTPDILSAAV